MDWNVVGAVTLVVSSAAWLTTHVATFWGLWRRSPQRNRLWLLLVPPAAWLAMVWGFRAGLRTRAVLWALFASIYIGTALIVQW